jgi:hypothetical protein
MITLKGPLFAEPGSTVCLTATNVGLGFSAAGASRGQLVQLTVKIDKAKHTATVCFVAPAKGNTVIVHVTDSSSSRGASTSTRSR